LWWVRTSAAKLGRLKRRRAWARRSAVDGAGVPKRQLYTIGAAILNAERIL
jgi:hypothetical protein